MFHENVFPFSSSTFVAQSQPVAYSFPYSPSDVPDDDLPHTVQPVSFPDSIASAPRSLLVALILLLIYQIMFVTWQLILIWCVVKHLFLSCLSHPFQMRILMFQIMSHTLTMRLLSTLSGRKHEN